MEGDVCSTSSGSYGKGIIIGRREDPRPDNPYQWRSSRGRFDHTLVGAKIGE